MSLSKQWKLSGGRWGDEQEAGLAEVRQVAVPARTEMEYIWGGVLLFFSPFERRLSKLLWRASLSSWLLADPG